MEFFWQQSQNESVCLQGIWDAFMKKDGKSPTIPQRKEEFSPIYVENRLCFPTADKALYLADYEGKTRSPVRILLGETMMVSLGKIP